MIINLSNKTRIRGEKDQWVLESFAGVYFDKKANVTKDQWKNDGYYTELSNALKHWVHRRIRTSAGEYTLTEVVEMLSQRVVSGAQTLDELLAWVDALPDEEVSTVATLAQEQDVDPVLEEAWS